MAKRQWGVFLCQCNKTLAVQAAPFEGVAAVVSVAAEPVAGLQQFAQALAETEVDDVLVGCCAPREQFQEALQGHVAPHRIHFLDLKEKCFAPHQDSEAAHRKALRMIRGEMAAAGGETTPRENLLRVEGGLVVWAQHAAGLRLAELLGEGWDLTVVLAPELQRPARFKGGRLLRGAVTAVEGRLGEFQVTVAHEPEPEERPKKPTLLQVGQIVVVAEEMPPLVRKRTGIHLVAPGDESALALVAEEVRGQVGLFRKPEQVAYDHRVCAGGAAGIATCGRCITACPYDAIHRDPGNPMRIQVAQLTCEGCGGCISACPTSALSFTDPSGKALYGRIAALLEPLNGAQRGQGPKGAGAPPVVVFHCGEMGERVLNFAAGQDADYPATVVPVEVPCLRFVSEANLLATLAMGAGAVGLLGCEDCPNGDRDLLTQTLDFTGRVLAAFGADPGLVRLITAPQGAEGDALGALTHFAAAPLGPLGGQGGKPPRHTENREMIAFALRELIEATGKQPGGIKVPPDLPFGFAEVDDSGCTLCRACCNVCPPHAFRFVEDAQALEFKAVNCIGCRLCEQACPEKVITVRSEFYLETEALDYMVVAQDEPVACAKCKKPYINRRALESIEAKVLGLDALLDTFLGNRRKLLRMCPDCRAVYAMHEVDQGWQP